MEPAVRPENSGLQWGLNPWPPATVAMLYQLSYEATDVGSRSVVGSYVPVKEMSVNDLWNKFVLFVVLASNEIANEALWLENLSIWPGMFLEFSTRDFA